MGWAVSYDTYNIQQGLRSFPYWKEQLKPRTDDDHASPVQVSLRRAKFSQSLHLGFKPWWGFSFTVELNHIIHRLCRSPSIPLSFNLAVVIPRRLT